MFRGEINYTKGSSLGGHRVICNAAAAALGRRQADWPLYANPKGYCVGGLKNTNPALLKKKIQNSTSPSAIVVNQVQM